MLFDRMVKKIPTIDSCLPFVLFLVGMLWSIEVYEAGNVPLSLIPLRHWTRIITSQSLSIWCVCYFKLRQHQCLANNRLIELLHISALSLHLFKIFILLSYWLMDVSVHEHWSCITNQEWMRFGLWMSMAVMFVLFIIRHLMVYKLMAQNPAAFFQLQQVQLPQQELQVQLPAIVQQQAPAG